MPEIIYQDDELVAINKPSGLLVHRSMIDRHETRFAMQMVRDHIGKRVYPVHRLDKPTSGVLLFALSPEIARIMSEQFAQRIPSKTYHALVRGYTAPHAVIDYALKEEWDINPERLQDSDKAAQEAVTEYKTLQTFELPYPVGRYETARYSWIEINPKTGRKHQIRRHMKHIFHPIVGDTTHGDGKHNQFFRDQFDSHRLLLHASALKIEHPLKLETLVLSAELSNEMQVVINSISNS